LRDALRLGFRIERRTVPFFCPHRDRAAPIPTGSTPDGPQVGPCAAADRG
jgi:hypothetical protein